VLASTPLTLARTTSGYRDSTLAYDLVEVR
jgi:hypothetical protein